MGTDFILNCELDSRLIPLQVGWTCLSGLISFMAWEACYVVSKHDHCYLYLPLSQTKEPPHMKLTDKERLPCLGTSLPGPGDTMEKWGSLAEFTVTIVMPTISVREVRPAQKHTPCICSPSSALLPFPLPSASLGLHITPHLKIIKC